MFSITDGYGHCGLHKYRPIGEVNRIMDLHGVARANLVQHMGEYDNSYLAGIIREQPERFSGVFLVEMAAAGAMGDLERWASTGHFRGVRMLATTAITHLPLWNKAAELGLHLVVSGPFPEEAAAAIRRFAGAHPGNALQLTHLGSPPRGDGPRFPSLAPLLAMADARNIHVQISGMHQLAQPPYRELLPAVSLLWEAFGEDRLIYGSNFPVMETDQLYELEIHLIRSGRLGIPERAAPSVMDANARRLWFDRRSLRAGSLVWRCAFG